jgi:rRNA-processing protein FCF1
MRLPLTRLPTQVVFDASFLMAVVEHPTTWLEDMTDQLGKVRPIILDCTVGELKGIVRRQVRKSRTAALALELARGFEVKRSGEGSVDDEVVSFASSERCPVATLDRELIKTLKARRMTVLGLRGGRVARL